ncbi:hypothetical protein GCM10011515_25190 [Tsuneonella deserti]|uniref:PAS domain protein n=1 Tax=Tsuneonella deserti TaxID=2035528 RepID=A0ABQ1SAB6_9SPHN|nr:hypothetical protein GCM10011515_25190 [Tsuneonella deserti]
MFTTLGQNLPNRFENTRGQRRVMDTLRGQFGTADYDETLDYASGEDDADRELPPSPVGQDERRMQVRAYNHWASLLADRNFPSIEDLDPAGLPDFGPFSVLLDFTNGIDDPAVRYLGGELATECDAPDGIARLSDIPTRSLLSRITDHYMQILANQAPIGFEAEFVNQRGATILYRGILLPFSSDDDTIDFIYGVINWKQMADQLTSDELLLEIDQELEAAPAGELPRRTDPVTDWADGPGSAEGAPTAAPVELPAAADEDPFPLPAFGAEQDEFDEDEFDPEDEDHSSDLYEAIEAVDDEPESETRFASLLSLGGSKVGRAPLELGEADEFGHDSFDEDDEEYDYADQDAALAAWQTPRPASDTPAAVPVEYAPAPAAPIPVMQLHEPVFTEQAAAPADEPLPFAPTVEEDFAVAMGDGADDDLYDCLAAARELALAASSSEDRSRNALYAAVGRAYDFSLAAQAEPEAFAELVAESGLTVQERAPMTPVVKLVFGANYDKTRLTEYAAVLSHAHRVGIARGTLARHLAEAEGGLKGVVQAERAYRRADPAEGEVRETPREALARKLREIAPLGFEDIDEEGEEFSLVMIRRVDGRVVVLGEVTDVPLVEKAAKKLVA